MLTAMGDVMRRCYEKGWITTRDGNVSLVKRDSSHLYITPAGVRKTIIHPEHIVKIPVKDGALELKEGQNPSGELQMHWLLHKDFMKTRAVVHAHPTHVVAAMYRGFDLQKLANDFPEIFRYTRVGPSTPAVAAISQALADNTHSCMGPLEDGKFQYDIVGQANHGVCAIAQDPWSAYEHIERLNHICEIVLASGVEP